MPEYRVVHSYNVQRTYFITCSEDDYEEDIGLNEFCNSETLDKSYDSWEHEDCIESKEISNAK
tara:strand:+ start:159 stop:347 length:189 start_codon:yes stop_codon:yes gene_type:complete